MGQQGAAEYVRRTRRPIGPGNDGCYVTANSVGDEYRIGADSRGLKTLFMYLADGDWAVSTSFSLLVEHLRAHGATLSVRPAALAAFAAPREFADQLSSFRTHFDEIALLPSFASVVVRGSGVEVRYHSGALRHSYEHALFDFVHTWRGRMATCTQNDFTRVHMDLSGGIDSRMVFAFALADDAFTTKNERHTIGSGQHQATDYAIASEIVHHYSESFGKRMRGRGKWSHSLALENWRDDSLGVYLPFYRHGGSLDPTAIHGHGAGGGNFRPHFLGSSVQAPVDRCQSSISDEYFEAWRSDVVAGSELLQQQRPGVHPLILHYREFRNRFHFGHRPRHSLVFTPLESILTDSITDREDSRDERQIYFDVMESLAPGLMGFRYDNMIKSPTRDILRGLTTVDRADAIPGSIYGRVELEARDQLGADAFREWIDEGIEVLRSPYVKEVIGESATDRATSAIARYESNGRPLPSHDRDLMSISYARAAHFVYEL